LNNIIGAALALLALVNPASMAWARYSVRPVTIIDDLPLGGMNEQRSQIIPEASANDAGVPAKVLTRPGSHGRAAAAPVRFARADRYLAGRQLIDTPNSNPFLGVARHAARSNAVIGPNRTHLDHPQGLAP
jgi:tripartite-type tricarboxylate transporter receptor subunit TctC